MNQHHQQGVVQHRLDLHNEQTELPPRPSYDNAHTLEIPLPDIHKGLVFGGNAGCFYVKAGQHLLVYAPGGGALIAYTTALDITVFNCG